MKVWSSAALLAWVAIAGCAGPAAPSVIPNVSPSTSIGSPSARPSSGSDAPSASPAAHAIVGEWVATHDCARIVAMLKDAGLDALVGEQIYGNGLAPEAGFDPADPCVGATPREHSHFFTAAGVFGSKDFNGEQVDDGSYKVEGDRLTINGTPFQFEIEGDQLRLEPLVAVDTSTCTTFECEFAAVWRLMVAMPGTTWTRGTVSP